MPYTITTCAYHPDGRQVVRPDEHCADEARLKARVQALSKDSQITTLGVRDDTGHVLTPSELRVLTGIEPFYRP